MASTSLFFDVFGRDHGVGQMFDNIGDRTTGLTGKLKLVGAAMGAGLLALGGAIAKTGFDEIKDAAAVTAQLEAGIKSTGGVANTTVDGMNALASSIQGYSGQTDDSIAGAQALLLTFTNIRNVGADKIFDQTTIAAADMAAKLGGDATSHAMMLGKALNDPAEGLSKLSRAGIQFTDAQKEQIRAMQASGDIMGAQKLMLGELQVQFGGAAEAAGNSLPGSLERSKRAFEDLSQGLLSTFAPALQGAAELMTGVSKWAGENQGVVLALAAVVGILAGAFMVLNVAAAIAASPFILIGMAIAALIAGLVLAYNNIGWFKDGVNAVAGFITAVWNNVIAFITGHLVPMWKIGFEIIGQVVAWVYNSIIVPYFSFILNVIGNVVVFIMGTFVPGVQAGFAFIGQIIAAAVQVFFGFRDGVANVVGAVGAFIGAAVQVFNNFRNGVTNAAVGAVQGFFQFRDGVANAVGAAMGFVGSIPMRIAGAIGNMGGLLVGAGQSLIQGLINGAQGMIGQAVQTVRNIGGAMLDGVKGFLGIKSPSKRAHDEVGLMFGAGIVGGIKASGKAVNDAAGDLMDMPDATNVRVSAQTVSRQLVGAVRANEGTRNGAAQLPPIYVQNPFTGEYLLTKVDERAEGAVNDANDYLGRRPSR